jgi:N-acetylglucosaminyldiphosphoundecaprenol N-acetyl-beta-D-mannosaminyltransferase
MSTQDFSRNVWCLFGVPIDHMTLDGLSAALRSAARRDEHVFLSTPNLNYVAAAWRNPEFRESLIESDLSVADGMPLIWAARLLGLPMRERVAGSDLMQRMLEESVEDPITIAFFGGEQSVAEEACRVINSRAQSGLRALGFVFPGYGSVEEMSAERYINSINLYRPDILSVSIGAYKGQIWLQRNRSRLHAKIVSHLGAVINFFAGSVQRAPRWMRKAGLEWLWRIVQEPALWRRYWRDGWLVLRLFFCRSLCYHAWLHSRGLRGSGDLAAARCTMHTTGDQVRLELIGPCIEATVDVFRSAFTEVAASRRACRLDLAQVTDLDARFIGLLMMLRKNLGAGNLQLEPVSGTVRRILRWNCADYLLTAPQV